MHHSTMNQPKSPQSQYKSIGNNTRSIPKAFHFVDTTNSQYRRNARSYLVTERLRQLRWSNNVPKTKKIPEIQITQRSPKSDAASAHGQRKQRHYEQRFRLSELESPENDSSERHMECIPRFAIFEGLDPLRTLPIASSLEMRQLVDHYTRVIPTFLSTSTKPTTRQHQPAIDLFHLYRSHPASFLGMLYHSARHKESLHNDRPGESLSIIFKIKTLREVSKQIENARVQGVQPDAGTILAIYQLAIAERMWGDIDTFRLHWRAMYDIIDARGGAEAFTTDELMYTKVLWNCFALLNARDGYYNCPSNTRASMANYDFRIPTESMISNCHYFSQSYTDRRASILRLLSNSEAESLFLSERYPRRVNAFQPGTVLHQVLNKPFQASPEPLKVQDSVPNRGIQIAGDRLRTENCRLACIIYLNLLFLNIGDYSETAESFLRSLEESLTEDKHMLSPEYLLWKLLRAPYPITTKKSREMWAQVIQILAVVKRARYQSVICYQDAMLLFLQLPSNAVELALSFEINLRGIENEAMCHGPGALVDESPSRNVVVNLNKDSESTASQIYSELMWFARE